MPSLPHLLVLLVIIMLFFGVGRLPDVLKQMGKGIREFKDASEGVERKSSSRSREDYADEAEDDEERALLEEFRRKRRASKQIARDSSRDLRAASRAEESDDDSGGDNDDVGSAVRSKSRSG